MGRLMIALAAVVTGVAAAIGLTFRRRRGRRDEVLELDPAPPLASAEAAVAAFAEKEPSVAADFGAVTATVGISPTKPKRRSRPRKKPASAAAQPASAVADVAEAGEPSPADGGQPAAGAPRRRARPKPATGTDEGAGAPEA
jgi:hypothetical protein